MALAGGMAGCCFWTAMFPTDVVKSRVQVSRLPALSALSMPLVCVVAGQGRSLGLILGDHV